MKLSNAFNEAKTAWINAVQENSSVEKQGELYSAMLDQLLVEAKTAGEQGAESLVAKTSADGKMNAESRKFFNEINTSVGFADEELLPQETINNIFEDMTTEHPLLAKIGLKYAGLRLKFLKAETSGVAVWGKIFGEIKGQLDATFNEEELINDKLTCFVVIPKDAKEYGPAWIERFVRLQIQEAFATALELAFLNGDGDSKPVGLSRDINNGSAAGGKTTYPEKAPTGILTFADAETTVAELTGVFVYHSTDAKGKTVPVEGLVGVVVNPQDAWLIKKQYTHLNANGVYVTALPFNLDIIESVAQEAGKVVTFVKGRYDAYIGGAMKVVKYDQTLALEDMELYTAKTFAFGRAKDEKAAAVWTLNVADGPVGE